MKERMENKTLLLDILACMHSWLLLAGIYPLFASFLSLSGEAFLRTTLSSGFLIISVVLSYGLLQPLCNLFLYILTGLFTTGVVCTLSFAFAGPGETSGMASAVITGVLSFLIFSIHIHTKISYGQKKLEFYEVRRHEEAFTLREKDMPCFLNIPQPYHWAWMVFLYLPGMIFHFTPYLSIMFGFFFLDVFVCLGHLYVRSLNNYIQLRHQTANLPVVTMHKMHRILGIIAGILLLLFMTPALLFGHEFEPVLNFEAPNFTSEPAFESAQSSVFFTDPDMNNTEFYSMPVISDDYLPAWFLPLFEIIKCLCIICFAIVIIILVFRGLRRMCLNFSVEDTDEAVFLSQERTDNSVRLFPRTKAGARLSVNQQIRKRYRKIILRATKGKPHTWRTPSELEQQAALSEDTAIQTLHDIYEKARYSKEGCRQEDLERLKQ